jgi:Uma2 family endonuclease
MRPYRFTVSDYYRMAEVGILDADERVELLRGEVVEMTPIGPPHGGCVNKLIRLLVESTGQRACVSSQNPFSLDDYSEPQPDLVLARPRPDFYSEAHPRPADVLLVIEVADTSLDKDRKVKLPLYAEAGIVEVWIVDVNTNGVEVCREPSGNEYRDVRRFKPGDAITLFALPEVTVQVSDFLG